MVVPRDQRTTRQLNRTRQTKVKVVDLCITNSETLPKIVKGSHATVEEKLREVSAIIYQDVDIVHWKTTSKLTS